MRHDLPNFTIVFSGEKESFSHLNPILGVGECFPMPKALVWKDLLLRQGLRLKGRSSPRPVLSFPSFIAETCDLISFDPSLGF